MITIDLTGMPKTPTIKTHEEIFADLFTIRTFLEWLGERGIEIGQHNQNPATCDESPFNPSQRSRESLLMEYFGIDPNKLEEERQALLEWERQRTERKASENK